jgi:uncharacterized protein YdiU (UPF0061 family)
LRGAFANVRALCGLNGAVDTTLAPDTTRSAAGTIETLRVARGYSSLGDRFVELRDPTPLREPHLVATSLDLAASVGLDAEQLARPEFLKLASGSARFAHVPSFASVYAGHQFGSWVPQLGDGRAITLGEIENARGERFEWQVKGAGVTAYSRFGDGRAVLRSTIREFLCSEAMHALGIPTTRALAIAASDDPVYRETQETAAVLSRIAPSHLRFGHFEFFNARGDVAAVKTLADYAIARFYPEFESLDEIERYAAFYDAIVERTAELMAQWQAVGFAHGVMNTDNMSVLGLTLDYGPFGFLDAYDPDFICNHTDVTGRYAFAMQPAIGRWNLRALGFALASLVSEERRAASLERYVTIYHAAQLRTLRAKFGVRQAHDTEDTDLFTRAFALLAKDRVDYTNFFRALSSLAATSTPYDDTLAAFFADRAGWYEWQRDYRARLALEATPEFDDAARHAAMKSVNPKYVLRNYLAQQAIEAAEKREYDELHRLHAVLLHPFDEQPENERYAAAPPDWAAHIEVSCSS